MNQILTPFVRAKVWGNSRSVHYGVGCHLQHLMLLAGAKTALEVRPERRNDVYVISGSVTIRGVNVCRQDAEGSVAGSYTPRGYGDVTVKLTAGQSLQVPCTYATQLIAEPEQDAILLLIGWLEHVPVDVYELEPGAGVPETKENPVEQKEKSHTGC